MSEVTLDKTWLYRIVHKSNLDYLLRNGMFQKNHKQADPNYLNIGDGALIQQRNNHPVAINPPNGELGEYVPFYFGPLSPMLLNIKTGYRQITQRPQSDIIYICCSIQSIMDNCAEWCFTDGHAKNAMTTFYNHTDQLNQVDFDTAKSRRWNPTDDDLDRMRRKQAEFLVKQHVPVCCVTNIVVYNQDVKAEVETLIKELNLNITIHIDPNGSFYY